MATGGQLNCDKFQSVASEGSREMDGLVLRLISSLAHIELEEV